MSPALTTAAMLLTAAGCGCFYLSAPNQLLRPTRLPARPAAAAGGALLLAGLALFGQVLYPLAATAAFLVWAMLALVALPHLGALAAALRRGAR